MKFLSQFGALLFIVLWVLGRLLNIFKPKWYWEKFIPILHEKEKKHPVVTGTVLLLLIIIMMYGVIDAIII